MMERLRSLPMWLRLLFAALPILICIPLACIVVVLYQQYASMGSTVTVTAQAAQTEAALAATQAAGQAALAATQAANDANLALTASALSAVTDGETATAAAAAQGQAETEAAATAAAPTDTPEVAGPTATEAPTEKPTSKPVLRTATPKTVTVTLRECRGNEGTVLFGQALPQSLHSFSSITFTVAPGTYHLHIDWFQQSKFNVDTDVEIKTSQTIAFGDQCQ
jgi:hypothetical protein